MERYLVEQKNELEVMNETGMDKITLDIEIVRRVIKSSKSNTSCGFGGVPAELLKSGIDNLYELLRHVFNTSDMLTKFPMI
jgi:hypothetical protein